MKPLRQKINFNPNWISREVVLVLVMRPAVGLILPAEKTFMLGIPKFAVLAMLKDSARNSKVLLSLMGMVLNSEKSNSVKPGPFSTPRPTLPQVPTGGM